MKPLGRRAMALPTVLSLIVILVLIAMAVASTGIATLNLAGGNHLSRQSLMAAEAGVSAAIREIVRGTGWTSYNNVPYGRESRYSVQPIVGPSSVAGQPNVPAGAVYLLASATTRGSNPRRVGVLISGSGSPEATMSQAISAGGRIRLQGGATVSGSLKASEDIRLQGGVKILPFQGDGRLLAGQDIEMQGGVRRDPSQDMRARGSITANSTSLSEDPARQVYPNDSSEASAPFIADYRFENTTATGEIGQVLPNPDPVRLLGLVPDASGLNYEKDASGYYIIDPPRPDVVQHLETEVTGALDLDGKIHLFVNGVRFQGGGGIQGQGTIVAGEGNGIEIQGGVNANANLLALRWPHQYPSSGNPSIRIQGGATVNGMILAHEDVEIQGGARVNGMVVAYRPGGGNFEGQGGLRISFDAAGLTLPGFESWLAPPSGIPVGGGSLGIPPGQPIRILSWQRL